MLILVNRVTQVTRPANHQSPVEVSGIDSVGNRTKLTYPDSSYITYQYDELNRLTCIKDDLENAIASYSYDALSRRTQLDYENDTQSIYQYDNLDRLTNLTNNTDITNPSVISSFGYTYDKVGNRLSMATEEGTHNYTYDTIYQVTNVDYPAGISLSDKTYNYDELGNRVTVTNGVVTNYTSNNVNQYTEVNSVSYTYDANGNLTNDGEWTYNYDYENRLTQATDGTTTANYKYDPFGRRIEKEVTKSSDHQVTSYIYDGDQIIGEYNDSGILQKKFVYGTGIDEPILMDDGTDKYYYHFDGLGSVTEITDDSGAIVEKYEYDVYGNTAIKDATGYRLQASSIANPYMFTGREYDSETGLYYYRARYTIHLN